MRLRFIHAGTILACQSGDITEDESLQGKSALL